MTHPLGDCPDVYFVVISLQLDNGLVDESVLDTVVLRVLQQKFASNLFDSPYVCFKFVRFVGSVLGFLTFPTGFLFFVVFVHIANFFLLGSKASDVSTVYVWLQVLTRVCYHLVQASHYLVCIDFDPLCVLSRVVLVK